MLRPGGAGARPPAKHQAERPAAGRRSGETLRYNLQSPGPGFPDTDSEEWLPSWKVSGFNRFYHFPPLRPQLRTDYRFPTVPRPGTPPNRSVSLQLSPRGKPPTWVWGVCPVSLQETTPLAGRDRSISLTSRELLSRQLELSRTRVPI